MRRGYSAADGLISMPLFSSSLATTLCVGALPCGSLSVSFHFFSPAAASAADGLINSGLVVLLLVYSTRFFALRDLSALDTAKQNKPRSIRRGAPAADGLIPATSWSVRIEQLLSSCRCAPRVAFQSIRRGFRAADGLISTVLGRSTSCIPHLYLLLLCQSELDFAVCVTSCQCFAFRDRARSISLAPDGHLRGRPHPSCRSSSTPVGPNLCRSVLDMALQSQPKSSATSLIRPRYRLGTYSYSSFRPSLSWPRVSGQSLSPWHRTQQVTSYPPGAAHGPRTALFGQRLSLHGTASRFPLSLFSSRLP